MIRSPHDPFHDPFHDPLFSLVEPFFLMIRFSWSRRDVMRGFRFGW